MTDDELLSSVLRRFLNSDPDEYVHLGFLANGELPHLVLDGTIDLSEEEAAACGRAMGL